MKKEFIIAQAEKYFLFYKDAEKRWLNMVNKDPLINCQRGCNACCRQTPLSNLVSGILIVDRIKDIKSVRMAIEKQGALQGALLHEHGLEGANKWLDLKVPCALLQGDDCRVYDLRPVSCSTYFVMGGPAVCNNASARTVVSSPDNSELFKLAMEIDRLFIADLFNLRDAAKVPAMLSTLGTMIKFGYDFLEYPLDIKARYINQ